MGEWGMKDGRWGMGGWGAMGMGGWEDAGMGDGDGGWGMGGWEGEFMAFTGAASLWISCSLRQTVQSSLDSPHPCDSSSYPPMLRPLGEELHLTS